MDGGGVEAVALQRLGDDIDFGLAVAEHDAGLDLGLLDQGPQRQALGLGIGGGHLDQKLGDVLVGGRRARGLDPHGILEELLGQAGDFRRHGRRKEQGLLLGRRHLEDALDVRNEAHVQHAVGFVDDQELHAGHQQLAALEMVQQTAGGGDQHVDAAVQLLLLVAERHAADQQRPRKLGALGVLLEAGRDLVGQFAGRGDDQGARHASLGAAGHQLVDQGKGEGGGLAGAGLSDAQHVLAGQGHGNRGGLDGGGRGVAGVRDRLEGRGRKPEF